MNDEPVPDHAHGGLVAENRRLNMEMAAYRQGCTPADARAMLAVADALQAHKDSTNDRATELRCPRGNKCGNAYHCADHDICAAEFERRIKSDSTKDSP